MKKCIRCSEKKPRTAFGFYTKRNGDQAIRHTCTACNTEYKASWQKLNPDKARNKHLIRTYGITLDEYNLMLSVQGGVCAICEYPPKKNSLVVDHDHNTGKIRGLLCVSCNRGIGYLKDNAAICNKAATYLERT